MHFDVKLFYFSLDQNENIIHSGFYCVFSSMDVVCLNMSVFTCYYMFVYMYVHALTPPACGLSSVLFYSAPDIKIQTV